MKTVPFSVLTTQPISFYVHSKSNVKGERSSLTFQKPFFIFQKTFFMIPNYSFTFQKSFLTYLKILLFNSKLLLYVSKIDSNFFLYISKALTFQNSIFTLQKIPYNSKSLLYISNIFFNTSRSSNSLILKTFSNYPACQWLQSMERTFLFFESAMFLPDDQLTRDDSVLKT